MIQLTINAYVFHKILYMDCNPKDKKWVRTISTNYIMVLFHEFLDTTRKSRKAPTARTQSA
jgi:hypothetical protein